jgi:hypothetical protein
MKTYTAATTTDATETPNASTGILHLEQELQLEPRIQHLFPKVPDWLSTKLYLQLTNDSTLCISSEISMCLCYFSCGRASLEHCSKDFEEIMITIVHWCWCLLERECNNPKNVKQHEGWPCVVPSAFIILQNFDNLEN